MNLTISDKFEQLVKDKEIQFDQKQYELINILAEKSEEFIAYTEQSLLKRIINKKMNRPLGMYIYGQVGRGKSMIMDLFYNNIDISQKRRVHFNEFMNEVHEQIIIWRKKNRVSKFGDYWTKSLFGPVNIQRRTPNQHQEVCYCSGGF